MLGFGKKKEKDRNKEKKEKSSKDLPEEKKRKKLSIKKLIFIIFLVLIAVGASTSGFLIYNNSLTTNDPFDETAKYKKNDLEHINLPEEIVVFTFTYFRKVYISMIDFNKEINLLDNEILRIEAIEKNYPDQKKITDKQKKTWEKAKKTLEKTFIKIEKYIKNIYVLFSVNKDKGLLQIENKKSELAQLAQDALTSANEKTLILKQKDDIPTGFIKGNVYKLKKKFL